MKANVPDSHQYQKASTEPSKTEHITDIPAFTELLVKVRWRWLLIIVVPLAWISISVFVMCTIWPHRIQRDGNNLVYWTPHKTGSTSMRDWLRTVASTLQSDIGVAHKYPNNRFEDHHTRYNRYNRSKCSFLAGHIRVPPVRVRENELKLGAVITTIREPFALLMSKYFHRTRNKLSNETLDTFKDPLSKSSRVWFFYWNDIDPCEQLRYYDGEPGCDMRNGMSGIRKRVKSIANRIDCVVDTDDPAHDLEALCRQMQLDEIECPQMPVLNVGGNSLYDQMLEIDHIKAVMMRASNVTVELRNAFLKRRCRFLDDGTLDTPRAEPPQWPYKGCNEVESTLEEEVDEDTPENDAHDDQGQRTGGAE